MAGCSSEFSNKSEELVSEGAEKRSCRDLEDEEELARKRVKLKDLDSIIRSEGMASHYPVPSKAQFEAQFKSAGKEPSRFTSEPGSETPIKRAERAVPTSFDLNSEVSTDENSACNETIIAQAKRQGGNGKNTKGVGFRDLDLNEDASSTVSPVCLNKGNGDKKGKEAWEGGSSAAPRENTSLKKWVEMKQNGFLTPNYGSIPLAPKQRGRKTKAEVLKRKMELAKKEQVDRFAKIAAPSGLLNGLNPGIINHVRNSKQVHSIIQALVIERGKDKDQENADSWVNQRSKFAHAHPSNDHHVGCQDLCNVDERLYGYTHNDPLALKLSSSATTVSENPSSLSADEPANAENVDTLSVKAASVASQWLRLLCRDTEGRLLALQRSKKRVQHVITTELPILLSKELSYRQENETCLTSDSIPCSTNTTAELHRARWMALFSQMEQELTKEEKELESQLNQVHIMMTKCEKGMEHLQFNTAFGSPMLGDAEKACRLGMDDTDRELAMKAAAASIYSTSSFAQSISNVKCC